MNITEELAHALRNVLEASQLLRDAQLMEKPRKTILMRKGGLAYAENQAREVLNKYASQQNSENKPLTFL